MSGSPRERSLPSSTFRNYIFSFRCIATPANLSTTTKRLFCATSHSLRAETRSSSRQRKQKQQPVEPQVAYGTREPFLTVPKQVVRTSRQSRGPKRHVRVGLFVLSARLREFFTTTEASKRYSVHLVCSSEQTLLRERDEKRQARVRVRLVSQTNCVQPTCCLSLPQESVTLQVCLKVVGEETVVMVFILEHTNF